MLARPPTPLADLRRQLAQRLLAGAGAERGGLLAALVLGSARVPLPLELKEAFRAAGLSHALAASGFHLSVLLGAVLPLGRRLPRWPRLGLAGAAMLLFVLLAGPQPSVLRAVLMGGLALAVLESGGRGRPFGILMASALILLLWRPEWLADVGFQLSVVATAALVVCASPLEQGLRRRLPPWCPGWLAAASAVPLAASLWTLPLQLFHFGVVPLYAVPANLVAAPLLTPLTLGAMALALVAVLVPPLLGLLLPPVAWCSGLLVIVVKGFAALPMAQWQLGRPEPLLVLLLAAGLLGLSVPGPAGLPRLGRGRRRRCCCWRPGPPGPAAGRPARAGAPGPPRPAAGPPPGPGGAGEPPGRWLQLPSGPPARHRFRHPPPGLGSAAGSRGPGRARLLAGPGGAGAGQCRWQPAAAAWPVAGQPRAGGRAPQRRQPGHQPRTGAAALAAATRPPGPQGLAGHRSQGWDGIWLGVLPRRPERQAVTAASRGAIWLSGGGPADAPPAGAPAARGAGCSRAGAERSVNSWPELRAPGWRGG
ncbi:ComEC/Rec2 family competence protein [Cyanobium sp. LEGE 06113]|uniref:ComEC/Rec2 family competence protein n=1 Tax=Cyanobium sp. LEGE 06113 TaxID=1297573 RepID=UPI00351C6C5A